MAWDLPNRLGWFARTKDTSVSFSLELRLKAHTTTPSFCKWVLRDQTQVPMLIQKAFSDWATPPASELTYKNIFSSCFFCETILQTSLACKDIQIFLNPSLYSKNMKGSQLLRMARVRVFTHTFPVENCRQNWKKKNKRKL